MWRCFWHFERYWATGFVSILPCCWDKRYLKKHNAAPHDLFTWRTRPLADVKECPTIPCCIVPIFESWYVDWKENCSCSQLGKSSRAYKLGIPNPIELLNLAYQNVAYPWDCISADAKQKLKASDGMEAICKLCSINSQLKKNVKIV